MLHYLTDLLWVYMPFPRLADSDYEYCYHSTTQTLSIFSVHKHNLTCRLKCIPLLLNIRLPIGSRHKHSASLKTRHLYATAHHIHCNIIMKNEKTAKIKLSLLSLSLFPSLLLPYFPSLLSLPPLSLSLPPPLSTTYPPPLMFAMATIPPRCCMKMTRDVL